MLVTFATTSLPKPIAEPLTPLSRDVGRPTWRGASERDENSGDGVQVGVGESAYFLTSLSYFQTRGVGAEGVRHD